MLPQPKIRRAESAQLSIDAQARQEEVNAFILKQYGNYKILETTEMYSGDIVDWIDPDTVPGSRLEPPADGMTPDGDSTFNAERPPLTELDLYPELRGPKDSIPMHRPTFEAYVDGSIEAPSLAEFIAQIGQGQPATTFRLYAGYAFTTEPLIRAVANIQQFPGTVEPNSFNILEMAVICGTGTTQELVGIVVGRGAAYDQGGTGTALRLEAEFLTDGTDTLGNQFGGWDGLATGLVPYVGRAYGPGVRLNGISDIGGPADWWSPVELVHSAGDWWLKHNGNWLGHYPGSLFNLINNQACRVDWYGEVKDPTPTDWTATNMGTGRFASQGQSYASYHKNTYYNDVNNVAHWPDVTGTVTTFFPLSSVTACYTSSTFNTSGTRSFYLGGPGGDNTGCD